MKIYKVVFEVVLKNNDTDWIEQVIEQGLERNEFIDSYTIEEVAQ